MEEKYSLLFVFFASIALFGLSPVWAYCLMGVVIVRQISCVTHQDDKTVTIYKNFGSLGLLLLFIGSIVVFFFTPSKTESLYGTIRILTVCFYAIFVVNNGYWKDLNEVMPFIGMALFAVRFVQAIALHSMPILTGGTFPLDVVLLLGVVETVAAKRAKIYPLLTTSLLVMLAITGNAISFMMAAVFVSVYLLKEEKSYQKALIFAGIAIVATIVLFKVDPAFLVSVKTAQEDVVSGIGTIPAIIRHPLGIGYRSYYYTVKREAPCIGVSIFEIALDYGIIGLAGMIMLFIYGIRHAGRKADRFILIMLFVHSLLFADTSFLWLAFVAMNAIDFKKGKSFDLEFLGFIYHVITLFLCIAAVLSATGHYKAARFMVRDNIEYEETFLRYSTDQQKNKDIIKKLEDQGIILDKSLADTVNYWKYKK